MSRWKVYRTTDEINPWATRYDGWEDGSLVLRKSHHGTWAEAIAHADHMARTVEVALPRITGDMEDGMSSWTNLRDVGLSVDHHDEPRLGQLYTMIYDGYSDIGVEAYDLKPLALALLALAQHKEEA